MAPQWSGMGRQPVRRRSEVPSRSVQRPARMRLDSTGLEKAPSSKMRVTNPILTNMRGNLVGDRVGKFQEEVDRFLPTLSQARIIT